MEELIRYRPFKERVPDTQYRELLKTIKEKGEEVDTQQEYPAIRWLGYLMRFDLKNGFPIITERDLVSSGKKSGPQFKMALGELCAFLNGAQTLEEMKKFGCGWWATWVTKDKCGKRGLEPGDLGPGSYGAAWRRFPTLDGKVFDQITALVEQINELPHLRTLEVSPWVPQYIPRGKGKIQKVVVVPCHGWFRVAINTRTREMTLVHKQRSADSPAGLVFNFIHYASLLMMLAQVTDYIPKEVVYFVDDGHIYLKQMKDVEDMLATEPERFPTVTMDPDIKNIFDFRPEHFQVSDYYPKLERRVIWTPV